MELQSLACKLQPCKWSQAEPTSLIAPCPLPWKAQLSHRSAFLPILAKSKCCWHSLMPITPVLRGQDQLHLSVIILINFPNYRAQESRSASGHRALQKERAVLSDAVDAADPQLSFPALGTLLLHLRYRTTWDVCHSYASAASQKNKAFALLPRSEITPSLPTASKTHFYYVSPSFKERNTLNIFSFFFFFSLKKSTRTLQKELPPHFLVFPHLTEHFLSVVVYTTAFLYLAA